MWKRYLRIELHPTWDSTSSADDNRDGGGNLIDDGAEEEGKEVGANPAQNKCPSASTQRCNERGLKEGGT